MLKHSVCNLYSSLSLSSLPLFAHILTQSVFSQSRGILTFYKQKKKPRSDFKSDMYQKKLRRSSLAGNWKQVYGTLGAPVAKVASKSKLDRFKLISV